MAACPWPRNLNHSPTSGEDTNSKSRAEQYWTYPLFRSASEELGWSGERRADGRRVGRLAQVGSTRLPVRRRGLATEHRQATRLGVHAASPRATAKETMSVPGNQQNGTYPLFRSQQNGTYPLFRSPFPLRCQCSPCRSPFTGRIETLERVADFLPGGTWTTTVWSRPRRAASSTLAVESLRKTGHERNSQKATP
jgi:hypothetical protein